jgi:hypothetical protein
MTEQLAIGDDTLIASSNQRPLTDRQQLAWQFVRMHDGVSADEVGALLHAHRERRPHDLADRCQFCARDGRSVLTSKALQPLVKYRLDRDHGRLYIVRDRDDQARVEQPPTVCPDCSGSLTVNGLVCTTCNGNPFYGL